MVFSISLMNRIYGLKTMRALWLWDGFPKDLRFVGDLMCIFPVKNPRILGIRWREYKLGVLWLKLGDLVWTPWKTMNIKTRNASLKHFFLKYSPTSGYCDNPLKQGKCGGWLWLNHCWILFTMSMVDHHFPWHSHFLGVSPIFRHTDICISWFSVESHLDVLDVYDHPLARPPNHHQILWCSRLNNCPKGTRSNGGDTAGGSKSNADCLRAVRTESNVVNVYPHRIRIYMLWKLFWYTCSIIYMWYAYLWYIM